MMESEVATCVQAGEGGDEGRFSQNLSLIALAQGGDKIAMERLVLDNMGLVRTVAARFRDRGTEFEDLMQIGTIGMLKAIRSFDLDRGTCFSTYAVPKISGEIRRFLRDDGAIKVSRGIKEQAMMLKKTISQTTFPAVSFFFGFFVVFF